jgi:hypothetical protein
MDDEGGGPISGTSSKASGGDGLPDISDILSSMPWIFAPARRWPPPPLAALHKLEVAGCHDDRSPPRRGLSRRGRTPLPSLGASACEELFPTKINIQGGRFRAAVSKPVPSPVEGGVRAGASPDALRDASLGSAAPQAERRSDLRVWVAGHQPALIYYRPTSALREQILLSCGACAALHTATVGQGLHPGIHPWLLSAAPTVADGREPALPLRQPVRSRIGHATFGCVVAALEGRCS